MNEPLVSVVTPFYNTAPYLEACIESVEGQRYSNFEYVLLDNCSTDGSEDIARRHANADSRIRLVRNSAVLPQVANYNKALSQISADARYVKVAEADNRLLPDCLARMVERADAHPSVGVVSSYNTTETRLRFTGLPHEIEVLSGADLFRLTFDRHLYLFGSPTTVLMRADLVKARQPFYDESMTTGEDLSACWDMLRESDFGFVHQVLTFVRTENESILSAVRSFDAQELDRYLIANRHARHFLPPQEVDDFLAGIERDYYRAVARGIVKGASNGYLAFHKRRLADEGTLLNSSRLSLEVLLEAGRQILQPAELLRTLRNRWTRTGQ